MTDRHLSSASARPLRSSSLEGQGQDQERVQYYYPPIHNIRTPPAARVAHGQQRYFENRVQSSISTESGSSQTSYYQQRKATPPSSTSQWPSPTLERTLVNSDQRYPSPSIQKPGSEPVTRSHYKRSEMVETNSPALAYIRDRRQIEEEDYEEEDEDDHALWVLVSFKAEHHCRTTLISLQFWLSILDPIHSLASCLFTFIVTFGLILALPTRLVHRQSSFGDQIIRAVCPMFKHHLEMMYATSVDYAFEWDFRALMLILIHLVSPLISVGVAIASWVTAGFWVFTSIMGNPDGTERRDDGADAVLAVRNWWERCLLTALRPRVKHSIRSVV